MEFTFDGNPVEAQGRKPYLERFIHAALYEARRDINSVVHNARRSRWPEDHHWRSISPVLDPVHVVVREAEVVADLVLLTFRRRRAGGVRLGLMSEMGHNQLISVLLSPAFICRKCLKLLPKFVHRSENL